MVNANGQNVFPAPEWFEAWRSAVAEDRELKVFGRWSTFSFALQSGEDAFLVHLREGKIEEVVADTIAEDSSSFTLSGIPGDWEAFLQETPPPFHHDLLAMNVRVDTFSIEGDWHPFLQHIRTIKRIFRIAQCLGARVA